MTNKRPTKSRNSKHGWTATRRLLITLGCLTAISTTVIIIAQYILLMSDDSNANSGDGYDQSDPSLDDLSSAVQPFEGEKFETFPLFDPPIWGTLNSGHYFGFKLSSPDSIETSLMWFTNKLNNEGRLDIRHLCNQNDGLESYAWLRHDFFSFGEQEIIDKGYKIKTTFVKRPDSPLEWQASIMINAVDMGEALKPLSVIQYLTTSSPQDYFDIENHSERPLEPNSEIFSIQGFSKDIGRFELSLRFDPKSDPNRLLFASFIRGIIDKERLPVSSYIHSRMTTAMENGTRTFFFPGNKNSRFLDEAKGRKPNIVACQLTLRHPSSFNIHLRLLQDEKKPSFGPEEFEPILREKMIEFDENFTRKFPILDPSLLSAGKDTGLKLSKVALSNMLGSIGYFHGVSLIGNDPKSQRVAIYGPIQLLTAVPSRSFFPRGFLWDEAFHNILIARWNPRLSNLIIKSWFDIMNTHGWIPREVILGTESMRRVPREFIIQYISNANPPAMFIVIDQMLSENLLDDSTLAHIYPRLKKWMAWFEKTQAGPKSETYRWRGRDELTVTMLNPKTLTSGLDDYPRASHPSPSEYHIDLRCWMTLAVRTLKRVASKLNDTEYLAHISQQVDRLTDEKSLKALHWSDEHRMFCDFGHNTEKVELVKVTKTRIVQPGNRVETYQQYERRSTGQPTFGCVPEFGYVSLFPMIFGLIDSGSKELGIILDRLRNEDELWSPYGIRSLSKSSKYYNKYNTEHDKPYWRGAIWINLNYLILKSLRSYSQLDGPYREQCKLILRDLRENIVRNVANEFRRTNYIWEQYDDETGQGKGSHPFTGWSSLILSIAADL